MTLQQSHAAVGRDGNRHAGDFNLHLMRVEVIVIVFKGGNDTKFVLSCNTDKTARH